jgi:hypothetical protein
MFKRRGEGGYGYIQFDDELSDRYCAIRSINDMRVGIRALLECNEQNGYEATISMQQIRSGMPGYVKPCYIKKSLQALRGIFKEATSLTKKAIHISLNDYVRVPEKKLRLLGEGESTIRKMVYDLNEKISEINADFLLSPDNPENRLSDMVADRLHQLTHMKMDWKAAAMNGIKSIPLLSYSNQEYSDAANLILQFGTDAVLYAIQIS